MSKFVIDQDGMIELIYADDLRALLTEGVASIQRASHVEPTIDGQWTADMSPVGGPILGPYETRSEALGQEVQWLETNRL